MHVAFLKISYFTIIAAYTKKKLTKLVFRSISFLDLFKSFFCLFQVKDRWQTATSIYLAIVNKKYKLMWKLSKNNKKDTRMIFFCGFLDIVDFLKIFLSRSYWNFSTPSIYSRSDGHGSYLHMGNTQIGPTITKSWGNGKWL